MFSSLVPSPHSASIGPLGREQQINNNRCSLGTNRWRVRVWYSTGVRDHLQRLHWYSTFNCGGNHYDGERLKMLFISMKIERQCTKCRICIIWKYLSATELINKNNKMNGSHSGCSVFACYNALTSPKKDETVVRGCIYWLKCMISSFCASSLCISFIKKILQINVVSFNAD